MSISSQSTRTKWWESRAITTFLLTPRQFRFPVSLLPSHLESSVEHRNGRRIIDPANLINFGQIIQNVASGTNVYVAAGNYLSTIVHLLESTGRFRVMSRPTVFTSNNKKAIIASGQEIPVPVSTLSNANIGGVINNTAAVAVEHRIQESGDRNSRSCR